MQWITRERPKIDRLACPWLIRRFIDPEAVILYVPERTVLAQAEVLGAIPFDVPGVEYSHYEDKCTFDYFLEKHGLDDPALLAMAPIIRGADTDNHGLAEQAAGLWAISAGMAFQIQDDQELLKQGMVIYDALYSWAKYLRNFRHTQQTDEQRLVHVYSNYLEKLKDQPAPAPAWAEELRELIQDKIDTNLSLNLTTVADTLQINPTYLSRVFARYFDDLSFGEYIRKMRIEKAIQLLETTSDSLAEIAYLTGFSDQSHFNRIFKKQTGQSPSAFRKANRSVGKQAKV